MKVKNLILFGFVLSAISYLSKQLEEDGTKEEIGLEDIDLEEIKRELGDRLEKSVVEFGDVVSAIVGIGSDAFDRFVEKTEDINSPEQFKNVQEEFDKVIEELDEEAANIEFKEELNAQAAFEKVFGEVEEEEEEIVLETKTAELPNQQLLEDLKGILDSIEEDDTEIFEEVTEEIEEAVQEEVEEEVIDEEEELFNRIQEAILRANLIEETAQEEEIVEDTKEASLQEIEDIFSEILESEPEEEIEVDTQEYIDDLIEDLKDHYEEEEETVKDIYDQINDLYPYLSKGFVRSVYDLKESIAMDYPYNRMVVALHRIHFVSLEDLHQFVEIVTNHNYGVNVDEAKMIVDLFKEYRNTDGKILTNIFEIANQAKLLRGDYEGYRIEVLED